MIKQAKKQLLMAAAMAALGLSASASFAKDIVVDTKGEVPYVIDARNVVARSGTDLCWRTGYWTPADAVPGCDVPLCVEPETLQDGKCVAPPPPAVPAPAPVVVVPVPVVVAPTSEKVSFAADAFFDFDKATLKPEGKAKLDELSAQLGGINLEVIIAVGHTDSVGTDAYNQKLSVRRADAVKSYLVSKGVESNRVYTEGKGEKQPVADNKTAEGRAKNRRVEIEVVGTRNK